MPFPSPLAQPAHAEPAPPPAAPAHAELPALPRTGRRVPLWVAGAVLLVAALALGAYLLAFLGPGAAVLGAVLAFLPLALVLAAIRVIDRWEPEPRGPVVFAVLWGAVASVVLALAVDVLVVLAVGIVPEAVSAIVQAPVVEEAAKGLGVLLVFAVARRALDGPVDGVVYGALVGAGFAFTENILYFADSLLSEGATGVAFTFFLRGVLSPFAHVMFTAVTGFALGLAARRGSSRAAALGPWAAGLVGAIVLHAVWNGSALVGDFFALYVVLQMPLFALYIVGIVLLRREEARLTRARLLDYAAAGWFSAAEVDLLATARGRTQAIAWARRLPGDRSALMAQFIREATQLAAARQRVVSGRDPFAVEDERIHLARATAMRATLLAR